MFTTKGFQLVGKGAFTKAYTSPAEPDTCYLVSSDPAKECLALFGYSTTMPNLFPKLERIKYLDSGANVFKTKFYAKSNSLKSDLDADQYALYKALVAMHRSVHTCVIKDYDLADKHYKALDDLKTKNPDFKIYVEALQESIDSLCNYGTDILFEISPRNVRVDNGKLVLLDVFFFRSKLREVINSKKKRYS